MAQTFATTRLRGGRNAQSQTVRKLSRRLPEIYAQRDEKEYQEEQLKLQAEGLKLEGKAVDQAKEAGERAEGIALGTMGISAGMAGMKLRESAGSDSALSADNPYANTVSSVMGGVSGGLAGGGVAKGLGAKKKWQKGLAGAVGGAAMTYLSGGDSTMSIGGGALIGGAIGALF
jgi:hypothetical protein